MPFSGQKLRQLREAAGLTREQMAARAGTTAQYISHLENGVKQNPAFDLVERLAEGVGATCKDFIGDTEPPPDPPPPAKPGRPKKADAPPKGKK